MWQTIERGEWKAASPLEDGFASIGRDGKLTFRVGDLESIGIKDRFATLLADADTLRLAVRAPREHELPRAVLISKVKGHKDRDTGRRAINGNRGLKALCLDPKLFAPLRVELTTKDDLLILNLAGIEFDQSEAAVTTRPAAGQRATHPEPRR